MEETFSYITVVLAQFLAAMLVITLHEFAHAYAAYKCGDPTAKFAGRLTLNPVKHFDPMGMLLFALTGFGWANPVPVNPNNFKNYKTGSVVTSIAGVAVNYLSAFLFYPLFVLVYEYVLPIFAGKYLASFLYYLFYGLFAFSLTFCVFNLLPLYPLDGFRVLEATATKKGKVYWFLREHGHHILLALIMLNFLANRIWFLSYFNILGYILEFAVAILGRPVTALWGWIFGLIAL